MRRQADADEGPVRPSGRRRRILEGQHAGMLLDALLHDGEAEAGPLVALGRDVRLGEARAVVLGQAGPVVYHLDVHARAVAAYVGLDAPRPARLPAGALRIAVDRLLGVLDQVDDRLGDEAPVAGDHDGLLADPGIEGDVVARHLAVDHGGFDHLADIVVLHLRL